MICDNGVIREETEAEQEMYSRAENPEDTLTAAEITAAIREAMA